MARQAPGEDKEAVGEKMTIITGYARGSMSYEQEPAAKFDRRRMWRTARLEVLRPRQFDDTHLVNTINMLQRRNEEIIAQEDSAFPDFGVVPYTKPEERWPVYSMLVREAVRRGLMAASPGKSSKKAKQRILKKTKLEKKSPVVQAVGPSWRKRFRLKFEDGSQFALDRPAAEELRDSLKAFLTYF